MDPGTTSAYLFGLACFFGGAATGHHGGAVRAHGAGAKNRRLNPLIRKSIETGLSPSLQNCRQCGSNLI